MAKFHYFYQSRENRNLDGWIVAQSRDDAYAQLRKQSIKPYKVVGKDPLAWKRWAAIAVLALALIGTYAWLALRPASVADAEQTVRHQIYGAQSVIRNGMATDWSACNLDEGERFLAKYAQPGVPVASVRGGDLDKVASALERALKRRLEPQDGELLEYRQVKQIVEAMKDELRAYVAHGGSARLYIDRLQDRQSQEVAYYRAANQELETAKVTLSDDDLYALWAAKNAELRAIGLPMLKEPMEE